MSNKSKQIGCPDCHNLILKQQLKQHIIMCKLYKTKILPTTIRLADNLTQDNLRFLLVQLEMIKDKVMEKLEIDQDRNQEFASYETVKFGDEKYQMKDVISMNMKQDRQNFIEVQNQTLGQPVQLPKISNQNSRKIQKMPSAQLQQNGYKEQIVICQNCQKIMKTSNVDLFTYNFSCLHLFCIDCIKSYTIDQYVQKKGNLKCLYKGCKAQFMSQQIREIFGQDEFDKFQAKLLRSMMQFIKCCKCNHQYQFVQGNAKDAPKTDSSGKKLTKLQAQHYAKNRFVCPNPPCKQQQCKLCHNVPYHLGRSCSQNQQFKIAKKCRYCKQVLKKGYTSHLGIKAFDDICAKKQCQKLTKNACSKIHSCKHSCYGYFRETKCIPCLNQDCCKKQKIIQHDQNQDSYCSICYVEDLKVGPCIMSKCGHIFHYTCLEKRLQIRWLTPRILFGFCNCPLCKQWLDLPADCPLSKSVTKNKELHDSLRQKALNRLKFQKLENDPKLKDQKSIYYKKPIEYAMAIYAYFQCFKCKKPYFGGRKSCAQMMNQQLNNSQQQFQPQKLVCPQCCPVQTKNCLKHGKQFIAFKCKFCCNIGIWFCWGSTHFCDQCHKRQQKGEYISKLPKDKLAKCEGKQKCASGGEHGQNGNQFCLGCLLCKNQRDEARRF